MHLIVTGVRQGLEELVQIVLVVADVMAETGGDVSFVSVRLTVGSGMVGHGRLVTDADDVADCLP